MFRFFRQTPTQSSLAASRVIRTGIIQSITRKNSPTLTIHVLEDDQIFHLREPRVGAWKGKWRRHTSRLALQVAREQNEALHIAAKRLLNAHQYASRAERTARQTIESGQSTSLISTTQAHEQAAREQEEIAYENWIVAGGQKDRSNLQEMYHYKKDSQSDELTALNNGLKDAIIAWHLDEIVIRPQCTADFQSYDSILGSDFDNRHPQHPEYDSFEAWELDYYSVQEESIYESWEVRHHLYLGFDTSNSDVFSFRGDRDRTQEFRTAIAQTAQYKSVRDVEPSLKDYFTYKIQEKLRLKRLQEEESNKNKLAREEKIREAALAQQRAIEEKQRAEEAEENELMRHIVVAYQAHWSCPSSSLLLGTVRAHPLKGIDVPVPDRLRAGYDQHIYDLPIWFTGPEMGLTIGSTGSGKFTAAIATNVMLYDGSCFVIDPKGEVCAVTAGARKNFRNQKVYRLDPFNITEFAPGAYQPPLSSYNPLDALDPNALDFVDDVKSLVEILVMPTTGDKFWTDQAKILIEALIIFVCTHRHAEGNRTLQKVIEYLNPPPGQLEWLIKEMDGSRFKVLNLYANALRKMPEKTRESIWTTANGELDLFKSPVMERVTSSSSFRFEELLMGDCTLYLVLDAQRLESHNRWLRLIMTISLMMAVRHKKTGQGKRLLWVIDEAAQLGQNEIIPKAYRLLRGYGVRMWTFWQDFETLKKKYPNDWTSLVSNSFVQVLSAGDYDTVKYFCDLAGEHEVEKNSTGESSGQSYSTGTNSSSGFSTGYSYSNNQSSGSSASGGENVSKSINKLWQWEARIRINDLIAMPESQMFIRFPRQKAGFLTKYHYFNDNQLSKMANSNTFYHQEPSALAQRQQDLQQNFSRLLGFEQPDATETLPGQKNMLPDKQSLISQYAERFRSL